MSRETISLPPCDTVIFRNGKLVFKIMGWERYGIEEWTKSIARESGQSVDWYWNSGCDVAYIVAIGDLAMVKKAIKSSLPELNRKVNEHNGPGYDIEYTDEYVDSF